VCVISSLRCLDLRRISRASARWHCSPTRPHRRQQRQRRSRRCAHQRRLRTHCRQRSVRDACARACVCVCVACMTVNDVRTECCISTCTVATSSTGIDILLVVVIIIIVSTVEAVRAVQRKQQGYRVRHAAACDTGTCVRQVCHAHHVSQGMLDFDHICGRASPSVVCMVSD
jgi:hypothetical protein